MTSLPDYPSDWDSRRKRVYKRDDYTCRNCEARGGPNGDAELHAHHGVPRSKGGTDDISNLITYCKDCHEAIHTGGKMAPTNSHRRSKGGFENINWGRLKNSWLTGGKYRKLFIFNIVTGSLLIIATLFATISVVLSVVVVGALGGHTESPIVLILSFILWICLISFGIWRFVNEESSARRGRT